MRTEWVDSRSLNTLRQVLALVDLDAGHLDIDNIAKAEVQEIVLTVTPAPCKCLGFKTPRRPILAELGKDIQIRLA